MDAALEQASQPCLGRFANGDHASFQTDVTVVRINVTALEVPTLPDCRPVSDSSPSLSKATSA